MSRLARILLKRCRTPRRDVAASELLEALTTRGPATARDMARRNPGTMELQWMRAAAVLHREGKITTEYIPCSVQLGPIQHLLYKVKECSPT